MSVIGIDIGNDLSVVAIARRGGIDVLANHVSNRQTPSMVAFSGKERRLGEDAKTAITNNLKNTVTCLKRLLGKKFNTPTLQEDMKKHLFYDVSETGTGDAYAKVSYNDEDLVLNPEKAMSMMLTCMRTVAENEHGSKVNDCVIAVPAYFTDAERHAMLDAAEIVGLNCLRLMNDITAAALAYGIYKTDLPDTSEQPRNVMFVDVGQSDTSASVVSFVKGKLTTRATCADRECGGRDFDYELAKHFCAEWKERYKIDAASKPKAWFRLMQACEKLKKLLSANKSAPINIECFMEDIDVSGTMERSAFEEMCAPILKKISTVVETALAESGLKVEDMYSVEIIGGSTRIPVIKRFLNEYLKKECSTTLNADECIAKGCALQGAMLSPAFRVRDFSVNDVTMYPVCFSWSTAGTEDAMETQSSVTNGEAKTSEVFSKWNSMPNTKMLTFYRQEPFELKVQYAPDCGLPLGFPANIGSFGIGQIPLPKDGGPAKLKVKVRLDLHGCIAMESCQAVEEYEEEVPVEIPQKEAPAETAADAPAADTPGEESAAPSAEPAPTLQKKKKMHRTNVDVSTRVVQMGKEEMMKAQEAEGQMALQDRILKETAEKMNALEAYVYDMRDKLTTQYVDYVAEADKGKMVSKLEEMENWLYDEGLDQAKRVYEEKYNELETLCRPVTIRYNEHMERPIAIVALENKVIEYKTQATSSEEQYAHIEAEEKAKVIAECEKTMEWLAEKKQQQDALSKSADPAVLSSEIDKKGADLQGVCWPIMTKKKPWVPPRKEGDNEEDKPMAEAAAPEASPEPASAKDMELD